VWRELEYLNVRLVIRYIFLCGNKRFADAEGEGRTPPGRYTRRRFASESRHGQSIVSEYEFCIQMPTLAGSARLAMIVNTNCGR
jgi:hypothetical protein